LRADERLLRQVIENLLSNALKHTPAAGRIEVLATSRGDGGLDLVVSDTGEGIAPDKVATIMEPFALGEDAFARSKGGLGLGLSIVKGLTELHGGRFSIESTLGRGTTARVHLPAERVVSPAARLPRAG
jgi:signal transduction histidine kinase